MEDYSEYLIQGEPHKCVRIRNWMAAIGLQDVDGLTPSNYMLETVRRNIEGEITIDEVSRLVDEYYTAQEGLKQEARTLEADKVSVRIAKLLSHQTFGLGPNYLAFFIIQYLKYLGFKGLMKCLQIIQSTSVMHLSESIIQIFNMALRKRLNIWKVSFEVC